MKLRVSSPPADPALGVFEYNIVINRGATVALDTNVPTPVAEIDNPPAGAYSAQIRQRNIAGYSPFSNITNGPSVPPKPDAPTLEVIP